ncbi:PucR family transcriptional regulator [Streptomyces sp. NPDC093105]|uniref:PucR family transcriptional regulator n=1 Tax=Streptomyces sp. NPDC093105 TaxID=3366029 RepID=UPI003815B573
MTPRPPGAPDPSRDRPSGAPSRPSPDVTGAPRAHTPLGSTGGSGALRRSLATALLADVDRLTDRAVADIRAHSGTYAAGDPVSREDLWAICRDNMLRALEDFGGLAPTGGDFEGAARETGRRRAEQGVPLDTVLRAYRRGGRVLWQMMAEHLRTRAGRAADSRDLELDVAGAVWETIDRYSVAMADAYRLGQLELQNRQDTRRAALFEALLDGRADDPAVAAAAAAALGVPAQDRYVVVVATQDPAAPPHPAPVLEAQGLWSFWRPRSGRYAGIVRLPRRDTSAGRLPPPGAGPDPALRRLLDALRERTGATAGVSPEFERLSQAGRALRLAEQTLRTLQAGSGEAAVFDTRLTEVLLSGRPDIAERIVTVNLGPVLVTGGERTALLTTLRVWLDHGCSASRAAELLYCHRNTVLNRIGRVAELTGRSSESGEARLGWALALRALPYVGEPEAPGATSTLVEPSAPGDAERDAYGT